MLMRFTRNLKLIVGSIYSIKLFATVPLFSHGLTISLPAIDVHQVQSPGFIQICGAIKN